MSDLTNLGPISFSYETDEGAATKDVVLIPTDINGTALYTKAGERLGEISTLIVDAVSGYVVYAITNMGGFLGIGDQSYPLPWTILTYDVSKGGFVVDASQERLEQSPSYGPSQAAEWRSREWHRTLHRYYGLELLAPGPRIPVPTGPDDPPFPQYDPGAGKLYR